MYLCMEGKGRRDVGNRTMDKREKNKERIKTHKKKRKN